MKIYLDLVMIINFFIDFLLLNVVNIILRRNVSVYKLMLGAFIGGISSLFIFFKISNIVLIIYKIIICIVINIASFQYKNFIYTFKNFIYLYSASICLGGFLYFIDLEFNYTSLNLNFIVLIIFCPFILYIYVKQGLWLKTNYSNYFNVLIFFDNKEYKLNGFLDTGNKLTDITTNKPVILIDINVELEKYFFIPFSGVNAKGLIKCFKAEKMIVGKKEYKNVIIGLLENKIKMDGINCLLNNRLREDLC